ncbi:MAG: hypothetical protein A2V87_09255 [Deltaproteobacteria bacterium RBG_16_58_17]|nr:MAG: hypothetical protein A2V87_09255 [Deltaproteobacteria bacterium RBG_16_58_17]
MEPPFPRSGIGMNPVRPDSVFVSDVLKYFKKKLEEKGIPAKVMQTIDSHVLRLMDSIHLTWYAG